MSSTPAGRSTPHADPADTRPLDRDRRVLRQFRLVLEAVKVNFHRLRTAGGLGSVQVWALSVVRDWPGIGVTELARALDVCQPTASNVVSSLRRLELIDAQKGLADGRTVQLRLRPKGHAALRQAQGVLAGPLPQALSRLEAARLARMERCLDELIGSLKARRNRSESPSPAAPHPAE